jgi:hypothetical protein
MRSFGLAGHLLTARLLASTSRSTRLTSTAAMPTTTLKLSLARATGEHGCRLRRLLNIHKGGHRG